MQPDRDFKIFVHIKQSLILIFYVINYKRQEVEIEIDRIFCNGTKSYHVLTFIERNNSPAA